MNAKDLLFVALTVFLAVYTFVFIRGVGAAKRRRAVAEGVGADGTVAPSPLQLAMGVVLLGAALLLLMKAINESSQHWPVFAALDFLPKGGLALGLSGARLAVGMAGNFVLGMLMMIGIGLYAPCMILIYVLGMDPRAAFPIMMGSCAFLMPVSSLEFVRSNAFHVRAALGLAIGGLPAVLVAAYVFTSLP